MERTSGAIKTMAAAAAAVVLVGLAATLYGLAYGDLPRSIAGLGLTTVGLIVIALIMIRRWVTDTRAERSLLAASQREAQAERARYFAAQAALENEQCRLNQDMAAARRALDVRLKAEREAIAQDFERQRSDLIAETMEATFQMIRGDKLAAERATGRLIQFPRQHPEPQPERARSREHGVVGP